MILKHRRIVITVQSIPSVVYIVCKPPIDPVKLVRYHIDNVKASGITHTKLVHILQLTQRFYPKLGFSLQLYTPTGPCIRHLLSERRRDSAFVPARFQTILRSPGSISNISRRWLTDTIRFSAWPPLITQYKVEARIRNHTTLDRQTILREIAKYVPERHKVDLIDPEVFILVEVFKVIRLSCDDFRPCWPYH